MLSSTMINQPTIRHYMFGGTDSIIT